jgi:hypothetical protein
MLARKSGLRVSPGCCGAAAKVAALLTALRAYGLRMLGRDGKAVSFSRTKKHQLPSPSAASDNPKSLTAAVTYVSLDSLKFAVDRGVSYGLASRPKYAHAE